MVCGTQDQLVRQAEVRAVSACWDGDIIPPRQKARVGGTWLSQPLAMWGLVCVVHFREGLTQNLECSDLELSTQI